MSSERILVVDDDEAVAQLVSSALAVVHFDVTLASNGPDAILQAKNARYRLIISDVNMGEMSGFQCRDRIRLIPGYDEVPFLFMSAAGPAEEQEIARRLGSDRLLLKPFKPADLRRAVFALLEPSTSETGRLPKALAPILDRIATKRETGVLAAVRGETVKRIVFQEGRIVFAASNDPRDLIGQAMLRTGLIKEKDLLDAFSQGTGRGAPGVPFLSTALTAMRKLTPEQSQQIFVGKIREAVLDVFLWEDGAVEYFAGALDEGDTPFPVRLDTGELRTEGLRRREKWVRVKELLPDAACTFEKTGSAWPAELLKTPGDRLLIKLIEKELSLSQILLELRGQDYAVGVRLAALLQNRTLRVAPVPEFHPEPIKVETVPDGQTLTVPEATFAKPTQLETSTDIERPSHHDELGPDTAEPSPVGKVDDGSEASAASIILARGLGAFRVGDLTTARAAFEEVLARDPLNALARARLTEVDLAAAGLARDSGLTDDARIALAVAPSRIAKQQISANDAFVLNRLAGGDRTVGELLRLCPMTEREVLSVVQRYLKQGLLVRKT